MDELTRLALRAGRGQGDALEELLRGASPDVWRFCAHLVDRECADDLTQETFVRALQQLGSFRGDAPVMSWLLTIARRTCAAEIAARGRRRGALRDLMADRSVGSRGASPDASLQVELALLLGGLDTDRRAAFVLTQILGCSYAETARICDCPVGTVRSRVARARDDLVAMTAPEWPAPLTAMDPRQAQ